MGLDGIKLCLTPKPEFLALNPNCSAEGECADSLADSFSNGECVSGIADGGRKCWRETGKGAWGGDVSHPMNGD